MIVSIIIPNYNGENLLKNNLPKVIEAADYYQEKTTSQVEIIVVDDCSTDNSLEEIQNAKFSPRGEAGKMQNYLAKLDPASQDNLKLKVVKNEKNIGFASTVNRGVKEAQGEIVVLLNTDVTLEKDSLIPLIPHFKDEKVFAVGCMDKSIENGKVVFRGRGIGKWEKGFLIHQRGKVDKTNTLWANGGSGAFRKSLWESLGGFNELYSPFYWEDIDLSYRALKSGYKIIFEPRSIVVHEHEKGSIKQKYSPLQIKIIAYRNQFIFVWINATDLDLQFLHLFFLPYHLLKAILRKDFPFFLGLFEAVVVLPRIIAASFRAQKYFVKGDKELMKDFIK